MAERPESEYQEIVAKLESQRLFPERSPALEPTRWALEASGLLKKIQSDKVIVVAGTNGKGTTCAALETLLTSAGQKVGLYTSPHLIQTTERIRICGEDISQGRFVEIYRSLESTIEKYELSHFESLTLMAIKYFLEEKCQFMILEVGLGGLWDATNAVPHHYSVITPIDFDHQDLLGKTLFDIGRNKFGIIGHSNTVIHAPLPADLLPLKDKVRRETATSWLEAPKGRLKILHDATNDPRFFLEYQNALAEIHIPGQRGADNLTLALKVFEAMGFKAASHLHSLSHVKWPGRMEKLKIPGISRPIFLSGDHNIQGMKSLVELLSHYRGGRFRFLVGMSRDKDFSEMLSILSSVPNSTLSLTQSPFKGLELDKFGDWLAKAEVKNPDPIQAFLDLSQLCGPTDRLLITGSLYLVGAIRKHLLAKLPRP